MENNPHQEIFRQKIAEMEKNIRILFIFRLIIRQLLPIFDDIS